jgi:hypothetical protein
MNEQAAKTRAAQKAAGAVLTHYYSKKLDRAACSRRANVCATSKPEQVTCTKCLASPWFTKEQA